MAVWPEEITSPTGMTGGVSDPFYEDTFETGDDGARPMFSRARQQPVTLTWQRMTEAEYALLKNFQAAQRAAVFVWTHPRTGAAWQARFKSDAISYTINGDTPGTRNVTVQLQLLEAV